MAEYNGFTCLRTFTDEEEKNILLQAARYGPEEERPMWRLLFLVLINYGPRISEVIKLRWQDVDFERGEISFPTLKRRRPMRRRLPLFPEIAAALLAFRNGGQSTERIFAALHPEHGRIRVWKALQKMLRRAAIPRRPVHSLRHTVGSRLALMDLATARDWLGHASVATTNQYVHAVRAREVFKALRPVV